MNSPYMPYSVTSLYVWHNPNTVDSDHFRIDFFLSTVDHRGSLERESFFVTEGIERVTVCLIFSIPHFKKHESHILSCDNIDLSSLDLIVSLDDRVSLGFDISSCDILTDVTDGSSRYHLIRYVF